MGEDGVDILVIVRWIAFIPAAVIASIAAWIAVYYGNVLLIGNAVPKIMAEFAATTLGGCAIGAAFVCGGIYVAPNKSKNITLLVGGVFILLSGGAFFATIAKEIWWGVWQIIVSLIAAGIIIKDMIDDPASHS